MSLCRTCILAVVLVALVGPHAAFGQFSAALTLTGDAQDPAGVFPLTRLAVTVTDEQAYGTNYWNNDLSRLQLNWSNSSAGLNLAAGATWAWGAPVLGLVAPLPHFTINDTNLSDGVVNIQNGAGIAIAPASPFTVGSLGLTAPAYNPLGGNTYTLNLTGGSYDDETLTAVIDVMPINEGDPDGVLLTPPHGTGLTLSAYTFTVVPGGYWTGGAGTPWQTPGNWSSAMTPGPAFTAVFDGPPTANQPALTQGEGVAGLALRTAGWTLAADGDRTLTVGAKGLSSAGSGMNVIDPTVSFTGPAAVDVGEGNTLVLASVDVGVNSLMKSGPGTLTLSGAGTGSGGTVISEGTLLVENASGSATGTGGVSVGGATLGGTGLIGGPVTLTGDATLTSAGTLTIDNTLTIQGLANQLAAGTVLTSGDVIVEPGAVFIVNGTLGGVTGDLIYSPLDASLVAWSVVPETALFGGAPVSGYITQLTLVPEPTTLVLLAFGVLAAWVPDCRRRA